MDPEQTRAHRTRQRELYGEPLGDSVQRVATTLGLSQAAIGRILGVSAPMLSQLVSGQRIKLGNPLAVRRLTLLLELCDRVDGGLAHERIAPELDEIARAAAPITTSHQRSSASTAPLDPERAVASVQALFRTMASGRQLRAAADLLAQTQPELAELVRVYGLGSPADALAHYRALPGRE